MLKLRELFKKFVKLLINFLSIRLKIFRNEYGNLSTIEAEFKKIKFVYTKNKSDISLIRDVRSSGDSNKIAIQKLKDLSKKKPDSHLIEFELFNQSFNEGIIDFQYHKKNFINKLNTWKKVNKIDSLDIDFIEPTVLTGSFGRMSHLTNLLEANKLGLRKNNKVFVLLNNNEKPSNSILFNYIKPYLTIIKDRNTIDLLEKFSKYMTTPVDAGLNFYDNNFLITDHAVNYIQKEKLEKKTYKSFFELNSEDRNKGESDLKKFGIPKNSWYVTFHIREQNSFSYKTKKNKGDFFEKFRNADPNSYIPAIKLITDSGGWVFRMGDKSMKQLPKLPNVIDYAHHELKSDFLDIFLGATSKFSVVSDSGFHIIPYLFGVPILYNNTAVYSRYFRLGAKDLFLPKLIKNLKNNKLLKLKDLFSFPAGYYTKDYLFTENSLETINCTEEDILDSVNEMLEMSFNNTNTSNNNLQSELKNIAISSVYKSLNSTVAPISKVSSNFLEKKQQLLF